ncbi:MAG: hypothetical protein JWO51_152 [Rhodospirillales bacterium]|nr:hypothetical protein [Rhodospirillales bacterium]
MLQVLTPATDRKLTQIATIKEELSIPTDVTTDDDLIGRLILASSDQIGGILRRVLALETVRETLRFSGWERGNDGAAAPMILSRRPITEIVSITENDTLLTEADWQPFTDPISGADGMISGMLIRLSDDGHQRGWRGRVVVEYSAGFALPGSDNQTLPPSIERACVELVSEAYLTRNINPALVEERIDGVGMKRYANGSYSRSGTLMPGISDSVALKLGAFIELLA